MAVRLKPVSVLSWGLGLLAIAAAWASLAPAALLGGTTYVSTYGNSMLPYLHGGDLVAVRRAAGYQVGDVVAYHNKILGGQIILHRVVGFDADRLLMKGDNNGWIDEYHPAPADVVGKEWFHVSGLGAQVGRIQSPQNAAVIFGVAGLFSVGVPTAIANWLTGQNKRQRRRNRERQNGRTRAPRPFLPPPSLVASSGVLLAAALVGLVATTAIFAFAKHQPASTTHVLAVPYGESGSYDWSATGPSGAVYPTGKLGTGDPVFVKLIDKVHITFAYTLTSSVAAEIVGNGSMTATVESSITGWKRTVTLEPSQSFVGTTVLSGDLNPNTFLNLASAYAQAVGIRSDVLLLTVVADVSVHGTVGGVPIAHEIAPRLPFHLDSTVMKLATDRQPDYGASGNWSPVVASQPGSGPSTAEEQAAALVKPALIRQVLTVTTEPNRIGVFGLAPRVEAVASWSFAGSVLFALATLLFLGLLIRGLQTRDEPSVIQRRYGSHLVPVGRIRALRMQGAVQVTSMASLARLAEHYDRMILHEEESGEHWYAVQDGDLFYFYRTLSGQAAPPRSSVPGEGSEAGSVER